METCYECTGEALIFKVANCIVESFSRYPLLQLKDCCEKEKKMMKHSQETYSENLKHRIKGCAYSDTKCMPDAKRTGIFYLQDEREGGRKKKLQ